LAIQHHSAVSPKRKPVTCPRAIHQKKRCARACAGPITGPSCSRTVYIPVHYSSVECPYVVVYILMYQILSTVCTCTRVLYYSTVPGKSETGESSAELFFCFFAQSVSVKYETIYVRLPLKPTLFIGTHSKGSLNFSTHLSRSLFTQF
jgi:hypothetical protein